MADQNQRIIVYTALLGEYDDLAPPPTSNRLEVRFQCFSDSTTSKPNGWEIKKIEPSSDIDARIRRARFCKTHPHTLLGKHDISIWIDANLALIADPAELVPFVQKENIATFEYPPTYGPRDCIYQEANACIQRGKDAPQIIQDQMRRFHEQGYPAHNGLAETSIVVRRNNQITTDINNHWWDEITKGSRRDQLSFNFVLWKHRVHYAKIPGARRSNPFTHYRTHLVSIYPL